MKLFRFFLIFLFFSILITFSVFGISDFKEDFTGNEITFTESQLYHAVSRADFDIYVTDYLYTNARAYKIAKFLANNGVDLIRIDNDNLIAWGVDSNVKFGLYYEFPSTQYLYSNHAGAITGNTTNGALTDAFVYFFEENNCVFGYGDQHVNVVIDNIFSINCSYYKGHGDFSTTVSTINETFTQVKNETGSLVDFPTEISFDSIIFVVTSSAVDQLQVNSFNFTYSNSSNTLPELILRYNQKQCLNDTSVTPKINYTLLNPDYDDIYYSSGEYYTSTNLNYSQTVFYNKYWKKYSNSNFWRLKDTSFKDNELIVNNSYEVDTSILPIIVGAQLSLVDYEITDIMSPWDTYFYALKMISGNGNTSFYYDTKQSGSIYNYMTVFYDLDNGENVSINFRSDELDFEEGFKLVQFNNNLSVYYVNKSDSELLKSYANLDSTVSFYCNYNPITSLFSCATNNQTITTGHEGNIEKNVQVIEIDYSESGKIYQGGFRYNLYFDTTSLVWDTSLPTFTYTSPGLYYEKLYVSDAQHYPDDYTEYSLVFDIQETCGYMGNNDDDSLTTDISVKFDLLGILKSTFGHEGRIYFEKLGLTELAESFIWSVWLFLIIAGTILTAITTGSIFFRGAFISSSLICALMTYLFSLYISFTAFLILSAVGLAFPLAEMIIGSKNGR